MKTRHRWVVAPFSIFVVMIVCACVLLLKKQNEYARRRQDIMAFSFEPYNVQHQDVVFFISKDSNTFWMPSLLSHVGMIVRRPDGLYLLDTDPCMTEGPFLTPWDLVMEKYCGHVINVRHTIPLCAVRLENCASSASRYAGRKTNPFVASWTSAQNTCTGLVSWLLFHDTQKHHRITPDHLFDRLLERTDTEVFLLKIQDLEDPCVVSHPTFDPCLAHHVLEM